MPGDFIIAGKNIKLGERQRVDLDVAQLFDFTPMTVTLEIIRGNEEGPVLLITAAIHGDETNGTEIARRLLKHKVLKKIKGTLIIIPVINVFGFNNKSRYLPDRRDLNRCFPGSETGSLAAQLANTVVKEVFKYTTHGIDLHTGSLYRNNFPQVRADLEDPETRRIAEAFNMPVLLSSSLRKGSLREAATRENIPVIAYEGGEALRFDERAIKSGLQGILNVMKELKMIEGQAIHHKEHKTFGTAKSSFWIRSPSSGIFNAKKRLGDRVKLGETIALISDPLGREDIKVTATKSGIIICKYQFPLVNNGDALFHIACFDDVQGAKEKMEVFEDLLDTEL